MLLHVDNSSLYISSWIFAFSSLLLCLLIRKKEYMAVTVGVVFGLVYISVDFGIFHLVCHSRLIEGGNLFWVLL